MKLFISADIEGCAGVALAYETHKNEAAYGEFAKQMTKEVVAACEAAHEAGADEIVVKDGHGDATNIDPLCMPDYVTLIRGKSGHPYNMMSGLDDSFDGVMYIGYHAPAGNPGFAISHTSTGNSLYIRLNGSCMSEFMLHSCFTQGSGAVPVRGQHHLRPGQGNGAGYYHGRDKDRSGGIHLLQGAGAGGGIHPPGSEEGVGRESLPVQSGASGDIYI